MAISIQRNATDGDVIAPPVHDDGSDYAYAVTFDGGARLAFTDTLEEILDVLSPGYFDATDEDQDLRRIRLAQSAAAAVQAQILADVDRDNVTDLEWAALTAPRTLPQPALSEPWSSEVPLIIVDTSYAPYTAVPRPVPAGALDRDEADNLWLIRAADPEELVLSLHQVGYLRVMVNYAAVGALPDVDTPPVIQ